MAKYNTFRYGDGPYGTGEIYNVVKDTYGRDWWYPSTLNNNVAVLGFENSVDVTVSKEQFDTWRDS